MSICRSMLGIVFLLVAAGGITPAAAQDGRFAWRIALDAPDAMRTLLEQHMDIFRYQGRADVDALLLDGLVARAAQDARQLLATEGYFAPEVRARVDREGETAVVRIDVDPGQAARIASAEIRVVGAIADAPAERARVAQAKRRWRLPVGEPFRQSAWESAKDALLREFVFDGYPAARIASSAATVAPRSDSVSLQVVLDSGPLFRFGALQVSGLERYPLAMVENLRPFREGDRYAHDAVLRYQSELQSSGHFRNASVSVDADPAHAGAAPVVVRVVEHPAKKLDFGIGYSTDTGPRGEIAYTHYNALRPGWEGTGRLRLDASEQVLEGGLGLLPEAGGWRNRLGLEAHRSDIENLRNSRLGLSARRAWRTPAEEHEFTLKFQGEEQAVSGGPADTLKALTLNYSWTLRRVDDLLRPRRGYLLNMQLGGAASPLLSTRSFVRAYGRGLYIVPLGDAARIHLRGELGAVRAAARDGIPAEFLFRAGGDQSVRGYAYQSLGLTDGAATLGARYLGAATLEYQQDFSERWGGAVFVDAGNAVDSLSSFQPAYGYGVGLRWLTPAGAVNLDVARAHETGKLRLHFTFGVRF